MNLSDQLAAIKSRACSVNCMTESDLKKLIEAVEVLAGALDRTMSEFEDMRDGDIEHSWYKLAREALQKVEEILK